MKTLAFLAFALILATPAFAQRGPDCRELRQACMMKDQLGERGAGNCRRYRELCSGGFRGPGRSGIVIEERVERRGGFGNPWNRGPRY